MLWILLSCVLVSQVGCNREYYVVGGFYATIQEWPFMAFLSINSTKKRVASCGSSLIHSRAVLTAAHCFPHKKNNYTIHILMGHQNFKNATMIRKVINYTIHENFKNNQNEMVNDIAICFLEDHVAFSSSVQKVPLMTMSLPVDVTTVLSAGWGAVSIQTRSPVKIVSSESLKAAKLHIVSQSVCSEHVEDLENGVICTDQAYHFGLLYHGDSGGPLITLDKTQIGIVSYCYNNYTVYTSVYHHIYWIEQTLDDFFCKHTNKQ